MDGMTIKKFQPFADVDQRDRMHAVFLCLTVGAKRFRSLFDERCQFRTQTDAVVADLNMQLILPPMNGKRQLSGPWE